MTLKERNSPRSRFATPGPRMVLRPTLPNRTAVTRANAVVSKYVPSLPTFPKISTFSLIWSGVCWLPGMFNDEPEAVRVNGRPE